MGDFNKKICRLCLEITPPCECETINENEEKLKLLLINTNFDISDDAVVCKRCLGRLQECLEFKSRIDTFVGVDMKVDVENICLENTQMCQLCMSLIKNKCFNYTTDCKDAVLLKDMIRNCLPEMDLGTVHAPLICQHCLSGLKTYYGLIESCKKIEQRIEHFRQEAGHGTKSRVDLRDMLKFKDCTELGKPITIKKECSDDEFADVMKCVKSEQIERIKYEEVDIKDELYNRMDVSNSAHSENHDGFGGDGSSLNGENITESVSKGNKYFCPKCPYSSNTRTHMKTHMQSHTDNEGYKCILCPFTTDTRFSLTAHMTIHKGTTKAFGCNECPYENDLKSKLVKHLLKHKDISEVESHKCPLCSYKSKYKSDIGRHYKRKHDTNITMQKCTECSFVTKHRENLIRHQLRHKNPKKIVQYKCDHCEYETGHKKCLRRHMLRHRDVEEETEHKCDKCPYRAKWLINLKEHMLIHREEHVYSCDVCSYSSNIKKYLLRHKRIHKENREMPMYKCKLCSYQAQSSNSIKYHTTRTHTALSERPRLKCSHCHYETALKQLLVKHIRRRHTSKDKPVLKCASCNSCDQCECHTNRKLRLNSYQMNHTELADTILYYCATCDFSSKYKGSLKIHVKGCLKRKRNNDKI